MDGRMQREARKSQAVRKGTETSASFGTADRWGHPNNPPPFRNKVHTKPHKATPESDTSDTPAAALRCKSRGQIKKQPYHKGRSDRCQSLSSGDLRI